MHSLDIVSFTIRDISDNEGYLQSLGKKRTAEVKRDAKVGEAEAERDAGVREAEANREKMSLVFEAETSIADSERKFNLQKAAFDKEVNTEQAKAKMAYELQVVSTLERICCLCFEACLPSNFIIIIIIDRPRASRTSRRRAWKCRSCRGRRKSRSRSRKF